jgi:glycosylphosphatidylinositol phospholipase D
VSKDVKQLLIRNLPYLQAGSFFPDWGYSCFSRGDAAEEAHWPRFWDEAIKIGGEKLTAFLFGVASHGVADASWHSLNTDQGFIQYLQELDFSGNYQEAHNTADYGGEMVLAHSSKLQFLSSIWKWPTNDLVKIYNNIGINGKSKCFIKVSNSEINACMIKGYFATIGVRIAGKYLMPYYAQLSPQLVGGYRDYFRGGISDMVNSVVTCWENLGQKIFNGSNSTQFCKFVDLNHSDNAFIKIFSRKTEIFTQKQSSISWLKAMATVLSELKSNAALILSKFFQKDPCKYVEKTGAIRIDSDSLYAQLGKAIAVGDFNGDGEKDIAISAPYFSTLQNIQAGIVYILSAKGLESGLVHKNADYFLSIKDPNVQRFGYSLAVVDINMDGIDDLAVSAPTSHGTSLNYLGEIYVFFGSKDGLSKKPNITIRSSFQYKKPHVPGGKWESEFKVLGEKLTGIDLDGDGFKDLLIGSPHTTTSPAGFQRGKVSAFYAASKHEGSVSLDDADWALEGSKNYELFGYSFEIANNMVKPILLIGSPGYREEMNQTQGRIYGFELNGRKPPILRFTVNSNTSFSQFGQSVAISDFYGTGEPILAVSSSAEVSIEPDPSFILFPGLLLRPELKGFQAGSVRYINISSLSGNISLTNLDDRVIGTVYGKHSFGHFGDSIVPSMEKGGRIWVTEPLYNRETGRIYRIESPATGSEVVERSPFSCYCGSFSLQRFGSNILVEDIDNNGKEDLIATTISGKNDESGSVYIFLNAD